MLGRQARPPEAQIPADPARGIGHEGKLREARDGDPPSLDHARFRLVVEAGCRGEQRHGDQDGVEENRGGGRRAVLAERVQNAAHERHERHAGEIGEGDAREENGELELLALEAHGQAPHEIGHVNLGQDRDRDHPDEQNGERLLGEAARALLALGAEPLGEHGHEGGVECAFREQRPEQVGEAEGDDEGVGDPARAHDRGQQHVAQEPEGPAQGRQPANRHKSAI